MRQQWFELVVEIRYVSNGLKTSTCGRNIILYRLARRTADKATNVGGLRHISWPIIVCLRGFYESLGYLKMGGLQ